VRYACYPLIDSKLIFNQCPGQRLKAAAPVPSCKETCLLDLTMSLLFVVGCCCVVKTEDAKLATPKCVHM